MSWDREVATAVDAVRLASRVCTAVQKRLVAGSALAKGDKSPVTVADFGAQAIVSDLLARALPHIPLIGEEDAAALRDPANAALSAQVVDAVRSVLPDMDAASILDAIDRGMASGGPKGAFWTLDPIDGTKGFLRQEQYAVALALIVDGVVQIGVLGCPNLPSRAGGDGAIFVATRGGGAFELPMDGPGRLTCRTNAGSDPASHRFCESVESGHTSQSESAIVAERLGITAEPIRMDSQAKYATVARGDASIYLRLPTRKDYVERIWDHAAGAIVITEAGGRVTDTRGADLDFSCGRGLERNSGVVATNGPLHDRVVDAVRQVLGA